MGVILTTYDTWDDPPRYVAEPTGWDPIFCCQERDAGEFDGTLFNGLGADEVPFPV